jgi:serine/threonine protein kinase
VQLGKEETFWRVREAKSLRTLPHRSIAAAVFACEALFTVVADEAEAARSVATSARIEVQKLRALPPSSEPYLEDLAAALQAHKRARACVMRSNAELEIMDDDDEVEAADVRDAAARLEQLRGEWQHAQRRCERARATLAAVCAESFPELAAHGQVRQGALRSAEEAMLTPGRTLEQYVVRPWPKGTEPSAFAAGRVSCRQFNGELCVLKEYDMATATDRRQLLRSVRAMRLLQHAHIATVEAVFMKENGLHRPVAYVHMPLYPNGTLAAWLQCDKHRPKMLADGLLDRRSDRCVLRHMRALQQVLSALSFVHAQGHVHGDLKLENVLVDDQGEVKLSDFDLSRDERLGGASLKTTRLGAGTPAYLAPEVQGKSVSTSASDMYAFGVCVLHVLMPEVEVEHEPTSLCRRVPAVVRRDPAVFQLLGATLSPEPSTRPTAVCVVLQLWGM